LGEWIDWFKTPNGDDDLLIDPHNLEGPMSKIWGRTTLDIGFFTMFNFGGEALALSSPSSQVLVFTRKESDPSYLIPDDLSNISACFSPGVSGVSGFEKACTNRGMQVFLADKSVDGPAEPDEAFHFSKKFLGATSNDDFMTLDEWVNASLPERDSDLLLQMDIEGHEYEVLLSASDALMKRFRIIVVEFHSLDQLWSKPFFRLVSPVFEKILQTHACVHIHPNNCRSSSVVAGIEIPPVMEFTFLRTDCMSNSIYRSDFPHPLDFDNTGKAAIPLPQCWYAAAE
jgi:hypothetical protein